MLEIIRMLEQNAREGVREENDADDVNNTLGFNDDSEIIYPDDNKKDNEEEDDNGSNYVSEKAVALTKSNKENLTSKH